MKRILAAAALTAISLNCAAAPAECDLKRFPPHKPDAQARVVWLTAFLETAERKHSYAGATAQSFRQALELCRAKREAATADASAPISPGFTSQLKCEALLICARIAAMELE